MQLYNILQLKTTNSKLSSLVERIIEEELTELIEDWKEVFP